MLKVEKHGTNTFEIEECLSAPEMDLLGTIKDLSSDQFGLGSRHWLSSQKYVVKSCESKKREHAKYPFMLKAASTRSIWFARANGSSL